MQIKDSLTVKEKSGTLSEYLPQYILAFLFPTLTVMAAFAVTTCYPFGESTILTVDLYHQYCPFLVAFRDKVMSGESLFYSWNDGLGQEYYAAYANYAASPLNIFSLFFNAKTMPVFIMFITCIRAGLSSIFMLKFLSANDNKRIDNITVIFSSSYALCGWYITFFWNIMWCDAVVLLPLVMLGLRKLLLERKWGLYMISLAVAIASNYYAGYFICLFLVLFAPCYYICLFSKDRPKGDPSRMCIKTFLGAAGRFSLASVIAAGATAALTIPTYLVLQNCSATGSELKPDFALQNSLFDFLGRLMVTASPNIRDGMANVYSGLVAVLLLPLFFLLPAKTGIKLKHKIVFGLLIAVMYLSFTNRTLNFIWHGFHFPNQIPFRESFIMSFLLVFVGFLTIRRIRSLGPKYITGTVLSSVAFLILYEKFGTGKEGYIQIGATLFFLIVQGTVLHTISKVHNGKNQEFFCETLITVTMMFEMFVAAIASIGMVCYNEGFTLYAPYGMNYKEISTYVNEVEGSDGHMNFERTELFPNNICDEQSLYNVKGVSIFSSTARENFIRYMRNFGFHNNNINGLRNAGLTRVTATMLNVRNLIEIDETQSVPAVFEKEYADGIITSWGNPDALNIGYMTETAVIDYAPDYDNNLDVFDKTNEWLKSMGGYDVYKPVTLNVVSSNGMTTSDKSDKVLVYGASNTAKEFVYTISVTDADIGSDIYIYANSKKYGSASIVTGDETRSFEIRSYQIISLGIFDGTPIEATIKYRESPGPSVFVYGYQLDREGYEKTLSVLKDEQLEVTSYNSTSLNGHIEVLEDGLLFLTVPYSEGWIAEVDGEEAEIIPIQDALMGIKLEKGSHDVSLKYVPAGFKEGLIITVICIFLIAVLSVIPLFIKKKDKNTDVKSGTEPASASKEGETSGVIEEVSVESVMAEESSAAIEEKETATEPATAETKESADKKEETPKEKNEENTAAADEENATEVRE